MGELHDRFLRWVDRPAALIASALLGGALLLAMVATTPQHADGVSWVRLTPTDSHGWTISRPVRGSEHDVVFVAARGSERVEVHVVARGQWQDVPETRSFGVGYEAPRTTASAEDAAEVTRWLAAAIAERDDGELGSIDAIPLDPEAPMPPLSRWLWSLSAARGIVVAIAMLALALSLVRTPRLAAAILFAVGLAVRVIALDLPFYRDQDIQRLLSGALPLGEILFGRGLEDRHPPLWFLVLHLFEMGDEAEWRARLPAAIAGALVAPAILWAVNEARPSDRVAPITMAAACIAALSPTLIGAAREVSEIPFFGLAIVALVAMGQRAQRSPSRADLVGLALAHAVVLWTYYTSVFVIVAAWAVHLFYVRVPSETERAVRRASLVGAALGLPALALAVRIAWRDSGARAAAHLHPDIAWGDATPASIFGASVTSMVVAIGAPILVLAILAGLFVRGEASRAALAIGVSVAVGTAALAPFARVQPYYVLVVAPMFLLALALVPRSSIAAACVLIASTMFLAPSWTEMAALYSPDAEAVVPRYLAECRAQHIDRFVTVAGYDSTTVAYYAARASGRSIAWSDLDDDAGWLRAPGLVPAIGFLTQSHTSDATPGLHAAERLDAWRHEGRIAVLAREGFTLPEVDRILEACTLLDQSPRSRLLLCEP